MKHSIIIILLLFGPFFSIAQEYRLVYDPNSLPELYNSTTILVEEKAENTFVRLPQSKYKLTTEEGKLKGTELTYDGALLNKEKGILDFTLTINGRSVPISIELPTLKSIRFNLYTDSIKPVLNFYVNVEGTFSTGKTFPLDTNFLNISSSESKMNGMEWVIPGDIDFEKVTFVATAKYKPALSERTTIYLKTAKDPRDMPDYEDKNNDLNKRRK